MHLFCTHEQDDRFHCCLLVNPGTAARAIYQKVALEGARGLCCILVQIPRTSNSTPTNRCLCDFGPQYSFPI